MGIHYGIWQFPSCFDRLNTAYRHFVCPWQHLTLDTNLEEEYIYRLRCLIAVPPVPPDYEQAIEWRKDMLADLKQYNADLARVAGNKVHLEVPPLC